MKYVLIFILSLLSIISYSQNIDKYHLTNVSTVYKDKEGSFVYKDDWDSCNFILTIEAKKKTASLYANGRENKFDLISSHIVQDDDGDAIVKFLCLDSQGTQCGLILTTLANFALKDRSFIKFEYNNKEIVYKSIDD